MDDEGYSIKQTRDEGYIFTGATTSYGSGKNDVFLIKTDQNGNKVWDTTFGGPSDDEGYSVEQTEDDGYILVGRTRSYGNGMYDVWLIKTDQNGNKVWDTTFGGPSDDEGFSSAQTEDGGYVLVGRTRSSGNGMYDVLMLKVDNNGNEAWEKTFGGPFDDIGYSILQSSDGGYIIAGTTSSYGAGEEDVWLIKTDQSGNMVWNRTFGGPGSELNPWSHGLSVKETDSGEYLLVGSTNSFGSGGYDVWFIKTDLDGNKIVDKTYGGPLDDEGGSIIQSGNGEYVILGSTSLKGSGGYDAWLINVDRNGKKIWDQKFGGKLDDKGYSIQQTSDGDYIFIGKTKSNNPPGPISGGCCENVPGISSNYDVWLIKTTSGFPSISVQPVDVTACEGQDVSFTVEAIGTQPLAYQWIKDGAEIYGANISTYHIPNAGMEDVGNYSVIVRNSCGSLESDRVTLKLNSKPSIKVQPSSQEVSEGSVVTFGVEPAGSEPLMYQWKKNGENVTGANEKAYSIPLAKKDDEGSYSVVVSNGCGWVESDLATLTVHLLPLVVAQPANEVVCEGSDIALNIEATGSEPLIYQWRKNGENITGANGKTYFIPRASINDAGSYSAIVSNCCGAVESIIANLTVNPKPAIQVQPASIVACEGADVFFSVQATGTGTLTYQWLKNGENISGANASIYRIPIVSISDAGNYNVIISSCCCGWIESNPASLVVRSKPSILNQPVSQSKCEGSDVSFSVEATGTKPFVYQWMKDGAEIFGANQDQYSIPTANINDSGSYSVVISNCCGLTISNVAILTIGVKPSVLVQPLSQTVCQGSLVSFSVDAKGSEPIAYQWLKDGNEIFGANESTYTLLSANESDRGDYAVVVSNGCGQVESDIASLAINVVPTILSQPVSQTVCEGSPVAFSVKASGTEPMTYQWIKDGKPIEGANSDFYSISSVAANDIGTYAAVISNSCNQIVSEAATLNLNFGPSILVQPSSQSVCEGSAISFSIKANGTEPLAYQWMKDGMLIANATSNTYNILSATADYTGTYSVLVSNSCGQTESSPAALALNVKPSILVQPVSQKVCQGSHALFNVEAKGTEPLAYQWLKDGTEIYGANSNSYEILNATANDIGIYAVIVSNSCGQISSGVATLDIDVGPSILAQPISQTVCEGSPVNFSVKASGTEPMAYQWLKDGIEIFGANESTLTILSATAKDIGNFAVVVSNSCNQIESNAASLAINAGPSILAQPISQTVCEGSPVTFNVKADGTQPLTYQWTKDGEPIENAIFDYYTISSFTANDSGTYSVVVSNGCGRIASEAATLNMNIRPSILLQPVSQTVCEGSPVNFSVKASGTEPMAYQWMKDGELIANATLNIYNVLSATAGDIGIYSVLVSNSCGQIESSPAALILNVKPSILVHPVSQKVCQGSPVSFAVKASGTGPLAYQWIKDGKEIFGANSDSYEIPSATADDIGSYTVVVSNGCGQIESDIASLAINIGPRILSQPVSQMVCEGSPVAFSVKASGTEPLAYQWMKDGDLIEGANLETYTIPSATASDMGCYAVVVSNSCGQTISEASTLNINVRPSIIVQPKSQKICPCSPVSFSVKARGVEPLTYLWLKDGKEINGANEDSFDIPCAKPTDSGNYSVIVGNNCGQIESKVAVLVICTPPAIKNQPKWMPKTPTWPSTT